MKRILFLLILLAPSVRAQTITLGPITKLAYCVGDTMTVSYVTSGNFNAGNTFTAQLSDATGSFLTFTNLGSLTTPSGSIPVVLSNTGNNYRVRIASTNPNLASGSNSSDIGVFGYPSPSPTAYQKVVLVDFTPPITVGGLVGDPIFLADGTTEPSGSTYLWKFNEDASPQTSSDVGPTVTYPTAGMKDGILTVTNAAGCSKSANFNFNVFSCNPIIPANAHVVTGSESGSDANVWVRAGCSYTANGEFTQSIFAESGASVTAGSGSEAVFYLKTGSSFTADDGQGSAVILLSSGNAITFNVDDDPCDTLSCSDLNFDYSLLPDSLQPKPAPASVQEQLPVSFSIAMNHLLLNSENLNLSVKVLSVLGEEVLTQNGIGELDVDLSPLPAGVYFAQVQSGEAREVRKIAVVH